MRTFLLLLSFISLFATTANANPEVKGTSITGTVISASDEKGVEFATISLHNTSDSALVSGTIAQAGGLFLLEDVAPGNYYLRIGFIGFITLSKANIEIKKGQKNLALGQIQLEPNVEQLQEVEITSEARVFETKIDKKVF